MVPIQLRTKRLRNQPASRQWNSRNSRWIRSQAFFPPNEVHSSRIGAQHDELGERYISALRRSHGGVKRFRTIAGQAKNKRAQYVHAVPAKSPQALSQVLSGQVEIFVNIF